MSIRTKIRDGVLYGGLRHDLYEEILPEIRKTNLRSFKRVSAIAAAIALILFVSSFLVWSIQGSRLLYAGLFLLSAGLYLITRTVGEREPRVIIVLWYILLFVFFGFGIILGNTGSSVSYPATTFCVLLFALPLLVCDAPIRMSVLLVVVVSAFLIVSSLTKVGHPASVDRVNAVSFLFIAIVVNYLLSQTKMREIATRRFIEKQRDTDALTLLYNRRAVEEHIRSYIELDTDPCSLLVIDVDNFKEVNDEYGHAVGDKVLSLFASCIYDEFRLNDIVGRFGGDEFVVMMVNTDDREVVENRVKSLRTHLADSFAGANLGVAVTASIGAAFFPRDAKDYDTLFACADKALYDSKNAGRDGYTIN